MSEETANLKIEHEDLDAEYQEATERALHDEAEEHAKRNRQDYSVYVE